MGYRRVLEQVEVLRAMEKDLGCWRVGRTKGTPEEMRSCQAYDYCEFLPKREICPREFTVVV